MSNELSTKPPLFDEIKTLIDSARQRAAVAVNAELSMLYWQVGKRIQSEVLKSSRAEYGEQVMESLAKQLTFQYGKGWSRRNLSHMVRFAECFPEKENWYALSTKLKVYILSLYKPKIEVFYET